MSIILLVAGYFAFQELKPKPLPPPPPPPPILTQQIAPIAPLLTSAEEKKISRSTEDMDENVRWQALKLLNNAHSQYALPLLFSHLKKDSSVALRIKILTLLSGYKKNDDVLSQVSSALEDYNPKIRSAALKAIDEMNGYAAAAAMRIPTRSA